MRREGELWHIRAQAGLSVVTILAVDIFFHFFYILTIPSDLKFASRLPDSALGGCPGARTRDGASLGQPGPRKWGAGCPWEQTWAVGPPWGLGRSFRKWRAAHLDLGIWGGKAAATPPGRDNMLSPAGLAYSNLVYDWVKAAVLFGVVNTVARLDHLDPPQPPKCITALYVFAET